MKRTNAFLLAVLAVISTGAFATPAYDMTVLTEPNPAADHYFGGQDGHGIALSGDGRTLAVTTNANGDYGKVHIFQRRTHDWVQLQELDGIVGVDIAFGSQVLISRDGKSILVVTAKLYQITPVHAQTYYDVDHYTKVGAIWKLDHVFNDPDPATGDNFGASVAMSADGGVVLISASAADRVYVYSLVKGTWDRTSIKDPTGSVISYYGFGGVVALSPDGTRALIGNDPYVSDVTGFAGEIYLYTLSDGTWQRTYRFKDPAPQDYADEFGQSGVGFLADGSVYIGDSLRNDGGHGAVFVYRQDSSAAWVPSATLASPTAINFQGYFGSSLAAAGQTLLMGGSVECIESPAFTSAYLFKQQRTGWSQTGTFADPVGCTPSSDLDSFTYGGTALSDNLSVIAIAAAGASVGALQHAGVVYIYQVQLPSYGRPIRGWPRQ